VNAEQLLERGRRSLLLIAAAMCVITPIELILSEHYGEPLQMIPFILCGLGLLAVGAVWFHPARLTIWGLRGAMALLGLGSALGIALHGWGNFEFAQEIQRNASFGDLISGTLVGGNPLLAPGILLLAALLALLATAYHPALEK
jgi:hypothetical protein